MINVATVRAHMKAKDWSPAELARQVGVSRQAVSLWLRQQTVARVHSDHLLRAAEALGVAADELMRPLPCFDRAHGALKATLLWDRLYPDLHDFAIAVNHWEPQAVARLVQVYGLYAAQKILGRAVWKKFPYYERYIHPARRQQLKALIEWRGSQTRS